MTGSSQGGAEAVPSENQLDEPHAGYTTVPSQHFLPSKRKVQWLKMFLCLSLAGIFEFEQSFELHHTICVTLRSMDQNAHGQWADPRLSYMRV